MITESTLRKIKAALRLAANLIREQRAEIEILNKQLEEIAEKRGEPVWRKPT